MTTESPFSDLRTRAGRRRQAAFRMAAFMGIAVVVCMLLLGGLGHLFSGLRAPAENVGIATLDVADVRPLPPPLSPPTRESEPPPDEPPEMPDLPEMDLSFALSPSALMLPRARLDADALQMPEAVSALRALLPGSLSEGPMHPGTSTPRRLIVPDLRRFYPRRLAGMGVEGRTRVRVFVAATGRVERVEVLSSVPPNRFEDAARRAMAVVRYEPAHDEEGRPVQGIVDETLEWRNPK